jgi:type II secretory pathway pseudopilin PulG
MKTTCERKVKSKRVFRYITLLELLIAIALVAMVSGVIAWNVRALFLQQKTLDEMSRVATIVRKAQELMMIANLDSEVVIRRANDQFSVALTPKSSVSPLMAPLLEKSTVTLQQISSITFEDAFQDTELSENFSLIFRSKGFLMNRGVLQMQGNKITRSIILHGFPTPVILQAGDKVFFPYSNDLLDEIRQITEQIFLETDATT